MNVSALDENGNRVVWWFAYKVPKLANEASSSSPPGMNMSHYSQRSHRL